jgi:hypothetical protein
MMAPLQSKQGLKLPNKWLKTGGRFAPAAWRQDVRPLRDSWP